MMVVLPHTPKYDGDRPRRVVTGVQRRTWGRDECRSVHGLATLYRVVCPHPVPFLLFCQLTLFPPLIPFPEPTDSQPDRKTEPVYYTHKDHRKWHWPGFVKADRTNYSINSFRELYTIKGTAQSSFRAAVSTR